MTASGSPRWPIALLPALLAAHVNFWMWDETGIALGMPVNLLYHVVLSASVSLVAWWVVRRAWPPYLDED